MVGNLGCLRPGDVIASASDIDELLHYRQMKEQGRLIIVPESFNVKTAVECITEYFCPSTFGLNNYTERCGHDDCKGCWEEALKGAENEV